MKIGIEVVDRLYKLWFSKKLNTFIHTHKHNVHYINYLKENI